MVFRRHNLAKDLTKLLEKTVFVHRNHWAFPENILKTLNIFLSNLKCSVFHPRLTSEMEPFTTIVHNL